ncbi:unnamed protein product [Orchesella dallaii]|uniref:Uncharacterized protein n=1 Tax=Orchesella dallaii TaxID=48710 RepID=A0ABP1QC15_9HEXA
MQALAVSAFVDEFSVYSSNKKWNRVLTRSSTINLPQNDNERASYWDNKYIAFDENRGVADILKRNTTIPLISLNMFGGLMVFNLLIILNQFFERNGQTRKRYLKCLAVSTWLSGALGIILLTLCTISMVVKHHYLTGSFGMAVMSLSRLVGVEQSHVPRELPQDNPISVKSNAVLFLQVFNSCRYGGVDHWNKLNELNGATHFEVPSYKQLIEMGLCVDQRSYVPQVVSHKTKQSMMFLSQYYPDRPGYDDIT